MTVERKFTSVQNPEGMTLFIQSMAPRRGSRKFIAVYNHSTPSEFVVKGNDMEHEQIEKEVAQRSALIYIPVSLGAAILFLLAASLSGDYPVVARIGGTVWVALLSLIVSMPVVISRMKKQYQGRSR